MSSKARSSLLRLCNHLVNCGTQLRALDRRLGCTAQKRTRRGLTTRTGELLGAVGVQHHCIPEVDTHSKVIMYRSSGDLHLAGSILKDGLILTAKNLDELSVDFRPETTELAIVNMPHDCLLLAFEHAVCDTAVVRVNHEAFPFQCLDKLLVVKQACNHPSVDGIQTHDNQ